MIKIIKETIVDLELSSVCNLSCIYCPRDKIKRKRRFIDLSSINQLADHLDPGKIVWFSGMGEPFLHPDLTAIITILRTSGALIYTNTNATAPHFQKTLTAAQQAGLNFVNVSVYGFDTESFQFTSQRDLFLILKENIEFLKASGLPYRLSYVQTEESPPNIKDRLETTFETKHIRLLKQHHRSFAPRPSPKIQCGLAQNYLFISSDGDIFPCVNDVSGTCNFGKNILEASAAKRQTYPFTICQHCDANHGEKSFKKDYFSKVFALAKR